MSFDTLVQFLIFIAMVVGGCFTVYQAIVQELAKMRKEARGEMEAFRMECQKEFESVRREAKADWQITLRRMDENKTGYYESFVHNKIYENDQKHIRERYDDKIGDLLTFFKERLDSINSAITEVKQAVKDGKNGAVK